MNKMDAKSIKEALQKRVKLYKKKQNEETFSIFKPNLGVKVWKCDKGDHIVDILPYFAGNNDPDIEKGQLTHVLEVHVHYNLGPDEKKSVICLERTFNKKSGICPICQHRREIMDEATEKVIKDLTPSKRCLYNIVCYDTDKEEDKGVQIWSVAHWFSEKHFANLMEQPVRRRGNSKVSEESEEIGIIYYMDPNEGKSIAFTKEGEGMTTRFIGHRLVDRDYKIDPELLEKCYCLDEIIHIPTYEEVYELFFGEPADGVEKEEVEKPVQKSKRLVKVKEEEPEEEEPEEEEEVEEEEEEVEEDEEESEEEDEEEEEEVKVKQKPKRVLPKVKVKKESEEEEDDSNECPGFGKDTDKLDDCDDCSLWDDCQDEKDKREEERLRKKVVDKKVQDLKRTKRKR